MPRALRPPQTYGAPRNRSACVDEVRGDRRKMRARHEAPAAQLGKSSAGARDRDLGQERQLGLDRAAHRGTVIDLRPERSDPAAWPMGRAELARVDVPDIAIERRLSPGQSVRPAFVDREGLAAEQLGRARRRGVGGDRQVEQRRRHPTGHAGRETRRHDLPAQVLRGEVRPRGHQSSGEGRHVIGQNRVSRRERSALAPWNAPPLGRPGLACGVQP